MISKSRKRYILSLQQKKVREEKKQYVIEGDKLVREYLSAGKSFHLLIARPELIASLSKQEKSLINEIEPVGFQDLRSISSLITPHNALAVVPIPEKKTNIEKIFENLCIALDQIQDPGNMGTIIRAAAWFGISNIICSENSVDVFNPKVVQASMGAMLNVKVDYMDIRELLGHAREIGLPVFGTVLEGESLYSSRLGNKGIVIFGNESRGIQPELLPFITRRIVIPKNKSSVTAVDSLNVGMAVSIVLSEFTRQSNLMA